MDLFNKWTAILIANGLSPDRVSKTGDDSHLFEFHKRDICLDVYPDGGIVILLPNRDGKDIIYELNPEDEEFAIQVLKENIQ